MNFARLVFVFLVLMSAPAWASADLEKMEAIYIQKLINYIDWPETKGDEFVIAVEGQDGLFQHLEETFRSPLMGKTVKIVHYDPKNISFTPRILCLFTSREKIPPQPGLLVITQRDEGIPDGAVINFVLEEGKLRFDINNSEAQRRELRINARLLKLARKLK
jgi:hypothetical protein